MERLNRGSYLFILYLKIKKFMKRKNKKEKVFFFFFFFNLKR